MGIPRHNTWFWLPRSYPNTPNKDIFHRENTLTVAEPGDNSAVTSMDIVLTNTFAPIPIISHQYASAQFLGPGQTQFQFIVHNVGSDVIREIQKIVEETQSNARKFRRVKDCARVYFSNNAFLQLAGIQDGIVESVDSWTEKGTTDLYGLRITFTIDGQHLERLNQEFYTHSDLYWRVIEKLAQDVNIDLSEERTFGGDTSNDRVQASAVTSFGTRHSIQHPRANISPQEQAQGEGGDTVINLLTRPDPSLRESLRGRVQSVRNIGNEQATNLIFLPRTETRRFLRHRNVANVDPIWFSAAVTRLIDILIEHSSSLPLHGFFSGRWAGKYFKVRGNINDLQNRRTQHVIEILQARERMDNLREMRERDEITEDVFRRALHEQNELLHRTRTHHDDAPTEEEKLVSTELHNIPNFLGSITYGRRQYFPSRKDLARPIRAYLSDLLELGRSTIELYGGTEEFEASFPGLYSQWVDSLSRNTNPAYADMNLPPHPVTERIIDTDPDFYFWNDSEESGLNKMGAELDARINRRLDRMLQSFSGVISGEVWRQTYLGRNLYGPERVDAENHYSITGAPPMWEDNATGSGPVNVALDRRTGRLDQLQRSVFGNSAESVVNQNMRISPSVYSSSEDDALAENRESILTNTIFREGAENDPTRALQAGPVDQVAARDQQLSEMGFTGHSQTRDNIFNLVKQSITQASDETLTMRRAFPTFKLYFIEDDTGQEREHLLPSSRTVAYFDDFYNYNSVKDMRIVRDRESPSSIAVITLTNVSGILDQRMWNHQRWDPDTATFINVQRESWEPGLQETELENPLDHLILKQGLKVQLRLGNRNNANKMPVKFNGEIVEIGYNHSSPDLITIVAQSYGNELILEDKISPDESDFHGYGDTSDLLHSLMCSPELIHFGRFEVNPQFNPAEARSTVSDGTGRWTSPSEIINLWRQHLIMTRTPWILANNPADDNIFAPSPASYREWFNKWESLSRSISEVAGFASRVAGGIASVEEFAVRAAVPKFLGEDFFADWTPHDIVSGIWRKLGGLFNVLSYRPRGVTIWEMFKEMELRHPGYVSDCRPYGTRMTMFFGIPDQRYWASQITRQEMVFLRQWERFFVQVRNGTVSRRSNASIGGLLLQNPFLEQLSVIGDIIGEQLQLNLLMGQVGTAAGRTFGRFRPFRKYHLITSENHILLNNIRSSEKGTYNAVTLIYDGGKTYTLKADDNIPDYKTITRRFVFPNCTTGTMARRYCIGLLMQGMKKLYKGELVITGQNIDPHDAIMLYDTYSDMYGPLEVRQVVDTFSRETGWITEITPDMCVNANEYSTTSTRNLMSDVTTELFSRYVSTGDVVATAAATATAVGAGALLGGPLGAIAVGGAIGAGAVLFGLGGYHFLKYTQDRQPIWINPLILNNRPFTDGLYGFKHDGVFANIGGRLEAEIDRVADGWQAFHLASYINDWTIGTARDLANQTGGGTYSGAGQAVAPIRNGQ